MMMIWEDFPYFWGVWIQQEMVDKVFNFIIENTKTLSF